jgi:hypothetical protein
LALPGVSVQIQDRFFALSRTDVPVGPRVCAIAKRSTADATGGVRDLDAYEATSESDVIDAFGENSNLHKAFVELISGGAQRIILVALPSDSVFNHTTATVTSSAYGGDVFNAAFEAAEAAQVDVIVPWGAGSTRLTGNHQLHQVTTVASTTSMPITQLLLQTAGLRKSRICVPRLLVVQRQPMRLWALSLISV